MSRRLLLAIMLCLVTPLLMGSSHYDPTEVRTPVVLVAGPSSIASGGGFDTQSAAIRVVLAAADRLRERGFPVRAGALDGFVIDALPEQVDSVLTRDSTAPGRASNNGALTLSISFPSSSIAQASGTQTRFGGAGDDAWRLASRVHRHVRSGLSDVMAYSGFDRGIVEEDEAGTLPGRPEGLQTGDRWVAALPLFSTNAIERSMLESPGTLDLVSMAVANAVSDYLSPAMPTLPRDLRSGWRRFVPSAPVAPRLVLEAENSTKVALTFDAGSYPPLQPAILDQLRDSGIRCTMFLTGDFVDRYPEMVVQMVKDGHEIGNHSDTHPDMTTISAAEMVAELEDFDEKVVALTGRSTRPWFRPPSGYYNDLVVQVAGEQGYQTIYWTADSADWRPDIDAATVRDRFIRYSTPGAILVGHLTSPQTAEMLPVVLRTLKAQGIEFGTLSEILGTEQ